MDSQETRDVLVSNGLPGAVLDAIARSDSPFRELGWSLPKFKYARELESIAPDLQGLCLIAEQNGEAVIGFVPRRGAFVRCYYEDSNEAIEILGRSYQQFVAALLLELEESGLREELLSAASLFKFERLPEFLQLLDADPYDDEATNAFVRSLAT